VCILRPLSPEAAKGDNGYKERLGHIDLVRAGAKIYLIMCTAKDVTVRPREISSFDSESVYRGGALTELDGECWLELSGRIPARELY
jgi:hypothetical protein